MWPGFGLHQDKLGLEQLSQLLKAEERSSVWGRSFTFEYITLRYIPFKCHKAALDKRGAGFECILNERAEDNYGRRNLPETA